ncbi:MAG: ABC transporter permease subunit [Micropruina sp.]|uniref:ABC transporter permease subunit n=1 Tax=Micropruina sp. TaxID=2737536 RepID=UPI0039E2209B
MNRLIGAELNRWFSRRLVWVVLLSGALLAVLIVAGAAISTRPMQGAELAAAEQEYAEALKEAEQMHAECLKEATFPQECDGMWTPERDDFVRQPPAYADLAGGMAQAGTMIAAYAALLLGASFIGAEFKTGSLGTWLTFVPSRIPVLVSKAVATLVGVVTLGVVVIGLFQAGAAGIVLAWSGADALQPAPDAWAVAGRGVVLTLLAGLTGFGLAALFGSTVGPIGVLLGAMVFQWVAVPIIMLLGLPGYLQAVLPDPNMQAFLNGGIDIDYSERGPDGMTIDRTFELGLGQASAYLGGLLAVLLALAGLRFAKREIR